MLLKNFIIIKMIFLSIIFLLLIILSVIFTTSEQTLTKILIANSILTTSTLFICFYSFFLDSFEGFSLIDISIIYALTSFIVNIGLIKFYKKINEKTL